MKAPEASPTLLEERPIYRGRVIEVASQRLQRANGHAYTVDLVRHPGAAAVVPIDAQDRVVLVRQLRHPIGTALLEIPAGRRDPGETPDTCAARELHEETGCTARTWHPLGAIFTTPGFCNEQIYLYLATDLQNGEQALDAEEELSIERLPFAEAVAQAQSGALADAKTVCGLLRADALRRGSLLSR